MLLLSVRNNAKLKRKMSGRLRKLQQDLQLRRQREKLRRKQSVPLKRQQRLPRWHEKKKLNN